MFQYSFHQNYEDVFEPGKAPRLLKLSNISENQKKWSHTHHMHEETELVYVAKGKSMFVIDDLEYERKDGDMIVIQPGTPHSLQNHSGVVWCCTIGDFRIKRMKENTILQTGTKPLINAGDRGPSIESILRILNELRPGSFNVDVYVCHTFAAVLTAIYYETFKKSARIDKPESNAFIKSILQYLNENYKAPVTLQSLAEKFDVSVSYLSHEFAKEYDISPINYVIERRISEAKILLASTSATVTDIANQVGYPDTSYFIRLFSRKTGITPKDYSRHSGANAKCQ